MNFFKPKRYFRRTMSKVQKRYSYCITLGQAVFKKTKKTYSSTHRSGPRIHFYRIKFILWWKTSKWKNVGSIDSSYVSHYLLNNCCVLLLLFVDYLCYLLLVYIIFRCVREYVFLIFLTWLIRSTFFNLINHSLKYIFDFKKNPHIFIFSPKISPTHCRSAATVASVHTNLTRNYRLTVYLLNKIYF